MVRMAHEVETDADDRRKSSWRLIGIRNRTAFHRDATGLGTVNENVVGPFKAYVRARRELNGFARGLDHCHASHERELISLGRRSREPHEQAREQIAGFRHPLPARSPFSFRLPDGPDPHRTLSPEHGKPHGLYVGRADLVDVQNAGKILGTRLWIGHQGKSARSGRRLKNQWCSDCAAAVAASIRNDG